MREIRQESIEKWVEWLRKNRPIFFGKKPPPIVVTKGDLMVNGNHLVKVKS